MTATYMEHTSDAWRTGRSGAARETAPPTG
jgi:hypothetical protein